MPNLKLRQISQSVKKVLRKNQGLIQPVIKFNNNKPVIFNLSRTNTRLKRFLRSKNGLDSYINAKLKTGDRIGVGLYDEDREIYRRSSLFDANTEPRTVHLGMDLIIPAYTEVFAPLDARVHSFQNNNQFGDYGPTIILEHNFDDIKFYTLYGHLSLSSLRDIKKNQKIRAGERIATIGKKSENGGWFEHLHFQIIIDMFGKEGDYPGVAKKSERDYYLTLCPDPNLILQVL